MPGLPIIDPRSGAAEEAPGVGGVGSADGGDVTPDLRAAGRATCVISDSSHAPLPSPSSAARSVSIVHGALSGPAPSVVACMRPQNAPSLTLPFRIGRNHQWSGMWAYAE